MGRSLLRSFPRKRESRKRRAKLGPRFRGDEARLPDASQALPEYAGRTRDRGELDPRFLIEPAPDQRNAFVAETAHSDGIGSFVLTDDKPMPWPVFARSMDALMQLRGPDLLRVKGFLDVEGCKGPVMVQFVQHLAHPPVELETWPDQNRHSRVVFITRNIQERQVRDLFKAMAALVSSS